MQSSQNQSPSRTAIIRCPQCRQDTLLKREPVYDGFKRVGEKLFCASCNLKFADEASVPFKGRTQTAGFTRADIPSAPKVFSADEIRATTGRLCRHCAHYVVNPFLQRCGLTQRPVEATDTCPRFFAKPVSGTES